MKIRLVTFDVLHTLITPRYPIFHQYGLAMEPYLGTLEPRALKRSFSVALRQLQAEKPVYGNDAFSWWSAVVRQTAIGAGADVQVLDASLPVITARVMTLFSSKEGYKTFEDSLTILDTLHQDLHLHTAVVSNADSRMLSVMKDLNFPTYLNPILLSESEGVEKPSPEIFLRALRRVNEKLERPITPSECVHVGDELERDYIGARNANMNALLLKRAGTQDQGLPDIEDQSVQVVEDMNGVLQWVRARV
ncbi:HAD hydrolase subfamily IA REG-2-like protein [Mycena crocata]|nr:HAD hydrolase subfamily IA REG-2-like protein [Mycena crocata]